MSSSYMPGILGAQSYSFDALSLQVDQLTAGLIKEARIVSATAAQNDIPTIMLMGPLEGIRTRFLELAECFKANTELSLSLHEGVVACYTQEEQSSAMDCDAMWTPSKDESLDESAHLEKAAHRVTQLLEMLALGQGEEQKVRWDVSNLANALLQDFKKRVDFPGEWF